MSAAALRYGETAVPERFARSSADASAALGA
jgi:hypothetical protein